jgi:hypothetical protein
MAGQVRTVRLLDPTARPHDETKPLARRHADLRGRRIGILDNTKSNADILMQRVAELLQQHHGAAEVIYRRKAHAAVGATEYTLDDLAAQCDAVLLGSGD